MHTLYTLSDTGTDTGTGAGTGTGLGLSLVKEHVKLHGGSVWVDDPPDGATGARFVVEIPGVVE